MVAKDCEDAGEHGVPRGALGMVGHLFARRRCGLVVEVYVAAEVPGIFDG